MLTTLVHLLAHRPSAQYERAFVRQVEVTDQIARNLWVERLILAGWLVIVVKCFVVIWAIDHWNVPFSPYWIIIPTVLMGALCTAVYYWRD